MTAPKSTERRGRRVHGLFCLLVPGAIFDTLLRVRDFSQSGVAAPQERADPSA